jgi:DNA-directed RNA polymerase subunit N (RpoN/RPB10)
MIVPIRCFSCGKPIGHLYEKYKQLVADGMNQKDALDKVGLNRMCCRAQFLGHSDVLPLINKFKKY